MEDSKNKRAGLLSATSQSTSYVDLLGQFMAVPAILAPFSGAEGGNNRCRQTAVGRGERTNSQSTHGARIRTKIDFEHDR
jgi:hypothetical protein